MLKKFPESISEEEVGTRLDFLAHKKNANRNKHQYTMFSELEKSKITNIRNKISSVIGSARFTVQGFNLDKPLNA